jgi:hypothetical protein
MRHAVHDGHVALVTLALSQCDRVIVALGPSKHLPHEIRKEMLKAVFGPLLSFVFLEDIAADETSDDWCEYVLSRIKAHSLPEPTDYYTGSDIDARWYETRFAGSNDPSERFGRRVTRSSPVTGKRLHVLNRTLDPTPSGSELGTLIRRRDDGWKAHVPLKIHRLVENHYAPADRVAILRSAADVARDGTEFPNDVPPGTRCVLLDETPRRIHELKPDLKWRVLRDAASPLLNPVAVGDAGEGTQT